MVGKPDAAPSRAEPLAGTAAATRPGRELFVYYRVAADRLDAACDAALAMQSRLGAAHPGLRTQLLRRPEAQAGLATLMETYARPGPAGVDAALQAEIATAAQRLAPWLHGDRHTEVFEPCA